LENKIKIVQLASEGFIEIAQAEHDYPITKLSWSPYNGGLAPDLFATSGDYFRLWELVSTDDALQVENSNEPRPILCRATLANVRRVRNVIVCNSGSQGIFSPVNLF
jgi:WD repeat-containing protein 68